MQKETFHKDYLPSLPSEPGVYQFIDKHGKILYIGKAKNLKKRVKSYFASPKSLANKTKVMVKHARSIEFILVDTEHDAILLENTMIKKEQPRYNVMLKDGKTYVYICIKNERFPRVFFTRNVIKDKSEYFGPYPSKYKVNIILDFIKTLFPLRNCKYNLSEKNIAEGKFKVCLEYHIKNCMGPCENLETEEEYMDKIAQIKNILKGNFSGVKKFIRSQMKQAAEELKYEEAEIWKTRLGAFRDYKSKSTVVSTRIENVDVFSIVSEKNRAFVNYMKVIQGVLINTHTIELEQQLEEDTSDLLSFAVMDIREKNTSLAKEIITSHKVLIPDESIKITVPQRGEKKHLLDLSLKNAKYFLLQKKKREISQKSKRKKASEVLQIMQRELDLQALPQHIECFDNSNIQGAHPVSSCVVFKDAKPSKKDYRKFHIKTVVGPDDFASMKEVVRRRYKRLLKEEKPLPQLVIIDGGKGQLSAAYDIFVELGIEEKIALIGIAKKLEEIYFPGDSIPLHIDKKSPSLKLIQHLRNEAHRFAITFHRDMRSKDFTKTALLDVPGVGEKTAKKLLGKYKSLKKVLETEAEEISQLIGPSLTRKIWKHFHAIDPQLPA